MVVKRGIVARDNRAAFVRQAAPRRRRVGQGNGDPERLRGRDLPDPGRDRLGVGTPIDRHRGAGPYVGACATQNERLTADLAARRRSGRWRRRAFAAAASSTSAAAASRPPPVEPRCRHPAPPFEPSPRPAAAGRAGRDRHRRRPADRLPRRRCAPPNRRRRRSRPAGNSDSGRAPSSGSARSRWRWRPCSSSATRSRRAISRPRCA